MTALEDPQRDGYVIAERPEPGTPRPYDFPTVTTSRLANGVRVLIADLPGRPLDLGLDRAARRCRRRT